jgi:alkylation response protein AidB-like acyl-CoA dehydrogenase
MNPSPVESARSLAEVVREAADDTERNRRVSPSLVARLAEAGLFRLCVPRLLGGLEADVSTLIRAIEELSQADGSTGWCLMIGATSGVVAGYLPDADAREIYGRDPNVVTGGVFAPKGTAVGAGNEYRVSGRWAFASGCQHCAWLMGGCVVTEDGKPVVLPSGAPDSRMVLFPASDARIHDTWTVSGLRGTGSHDIEVTDLRVPKSRSVSIVTDRPRESGALYLFPVFGLLAIGVASVAIGIARSALDEFRSIAGGKIPTGSRRRLADRAVTQAEVAQSEATLRSARAFLFDAVGEAWQDAVREGVLPLERRAAIRLAATNAAIASARAVDVAYNAGGGSSIYDSSPLQRQFRDVHAVTQHVMVSPATWELAGRILLGLETDTSML